MSTEAKKRGVFIAIEGMDGSGKSTVTKAIVDMLREADIQVTQTLEIGGTAIGRKIRELTVSQQEEPLDPVARLLMVLASRIQHLNLVVKPAMARDEVVVSDRYEMSTFVYQLDVDNIQNKYNAIRTEELGIDVKPDLYIFLNVSPEMAYHRGRNRQFVDNDTYKKDLNQAKLIHDSYLRRARQAAYQGINVFPIDANLGIDEIKSTYFSHLLAIVKTLHNNGAVAEFHPLELPAYEGIAQEFENTWSVDEALGRR